MTDVIARVTADKTGVSTAFNGLYEFLVKNYSAGQNAAENIVLNNTILTFDAVDGAFYYSRQCFRSLADRVITGIPTKIDADDSELARIGSTNDINIGDAYSKYYRDLVERAVKSADRELTDAELLRISTLDSGIEDKHDEIEDIRVEVEESWSRVAAARGIDREHPDYEMERLNYLSQVRVGSRIKRRQEQIADSLIEIRDIRRSRYSTVQQAQLAEILRELYLVERQPSYPNNPRLETVYNYGPIQLGNLSVLGTDLGDMVSGPRIWSNPSVDMLGKSVSESPSGEPLERRTFEVRHNETHEFSMERRWKVRTSARKFIFFRVSASASKVERIKESLTKLASIKVSFSGIEEALVVRDRWFVSSIFEFEDVKEVLSANPDLKRRLAYVINSLILLRGISVELEFDQQTAADEFKSLGLSGSAGFSLFGIRFSAGGNGTSGHTHTVDATSDQRKVTIKDDVNHWRVVGFRVEKTIDAFNDDELAVDDDPTNYDFESIGPMASGVEVAYSVRYFSEQLEDFFRVEASEDE